MTDIQKAAILCRSVKDPDGRSRARQEEHCRHVCDESGWEVVEVVSIEGSGTAGIERLSSILPDVDVLVAWEASRISRNTSELEQFANRCQELDVEWCLGGAMSETGIRRMGWLK